MGETEGARRSRFIADQRTNYRVPHTITCALLGVSLAWFYKWVSHAKGPAAVSGLHTKRDLRRDSVDRAVRVMFGKRRGLHGSPRLHTDLVEDGWVVSEKTVADSMRRQGLIARKIKRRNGLTKQDKTAPKFPDLLRRDFTAERANTRWVGDMTEIPTAGGKLYLATVIDLYSRRLLGAATGLHPDADLACSAIKMAVAARGGVDAVNGPNWREDESQQVIFHTDSKTVRAKVFPGFVTHTPIDPGVTVVSEVFSQHPDPHSDRPRKVSFPGLVGCSGTPPARPAVSPDPCD